MIDKEPGQFEGSTFCRKQIGVHPEVMGYRILVRAPFIKGQTKGGIILTAETRETQQRYENVGLVLAMGPTCYLGDLFKNEPGPRCKVGDWIHYSSYEKERYPVNDFMCFYITDDRVHSVIPEEDYPVILGNKY